MAEKPPSENELQRRLMEDEVTDLPPTPDMPKDEKPKIIFDDEDPEEFKRLMAEGMEAEGGGQSSAQSSGATQIDVLRDIERLVRDLPSAIANALGVD